MTLIELANKFAQKQITEEDLLKESTRDKLNIYRPKMNKDPEKAIYSDGDGNSWEEVRSQLVDNQKMSFIDYGTFYRIVSRAQEAKF